MAYNPPVFRLRSRGKMDGSRVSVSQRKWGSCSETDWIQTGTQPLMGAGQTSTIGDWVVDRYHHRVKQGEVFFNPVSIKVTTATPSATGGDVHRRSKTTFVCGAQTVATEVRSLGNQIENLYRAAKGMPFTAGGLLPFNQQIATADYSDLVAELSTRVQSDRGRSAQDLFEDVAEIDKSLSILSDLYKSVTKIVTATKAKHASAAAAEVWLMYRYGIRPLVQDIAGVFEGLKQKLGRRRITTRARDSVSRSNTKLVTYSASDQVVDMQDFESDTVEIRVMSLDEFNASLLFNIGFSPKSLVTLPWELVKYSFVVDWFVNAGEFLGALVPAFGFTQLGSCVVVRRTLQHQIAALASRPATSSDIVVPASGSFVQVQQTTDRSSGLSSPSFGIKSDFRLSNLTRVLDASSLLLQRFAR